MKKYLIALAIGLTTLTINAQGRQGGHKPDPQKQTDKMAQELNLTADQKTKVLALNTDVAQKMDALKTNGAGADGNFREQRKKIETDKETQLKTILTADQFQKYTQIKEEMRQKRKDARTQGGE